MDIQQFRDKYGILACGLSDEEIQQIINKEKLFDPDKYYIDSIRDKAHWGYTSVGSFMLSTRIITYHN